MSKKQRIFLLIAAILGLLYVASTLWFRFGPDIRHDEPFVSEHPYLFAVVFITFNGTFSWICSRMAKRRGLSPEKWARYGFLGTIWSFLWLYFIEDVEERPNQSPEIDA